jgi:hypothetical protein
MSIIYLEQINQYKVPQLENDAILSSLSWVAPTDIASGAEDGDSSQAFLAELPPATTTTIPAREIINYILYNSFLISGRCMLLKNKGHSINYIEQSTYAK